MEETDWGGQRPTAHTAPRRVAFLSVHTSPLAQAGTGDGGGMNVALDMLGRRLVAAGMDVHVFTRAPGRDVPPTVDSGGVAVHHLPAGPPTLGKSQLASHLCAFYLAFAAHPAARGLDLVHGHYWMSGWIGRQASRRLGLPFVQTFHTLARAKNAALAPGDQPESPLRLAAEERVVAAADALVAATPAEAALLRDAYRAQRGQVHVVEPGVDRTVFHPDTDDREATREALGGGRIILFVGRLQPLKAPDVAVRALAALDRLLPDDGIPTRLVVVGGASGPTGRRAGPAALRRLAAELGVADRVAFLAPRAHAQLASLYRAADTVIMPSRSESFGLVALEAQACGTPVVASSVGGLQHVLGPIEGEPGGGTLVSDHEAGAFASALVPYLLSPEARRAAGAAGQRRADRLTWERTAARTMAVYRRIFERSAAGRGTVPAAAPGQTSRGA